MDENKDSIFKREQDGMNNLRRQCKRTSSPKRGAHGRRQISKKLSLPGTGNMASSWPSNQMYSFQYPQGYQGVLSHESDQVEEMEVDHLQDASSTKRENIQKPAIPSGTTQVATRAAASPKEGVLPLQRKQLQQSLPSESAKSTPVYIILHVTRIDLRGHIYPAVSPVKISAETVSFNMEEKNAPRAVLFRVNCTDITKVQTKFDSHPFNLRISFYDTSTESLLAESRDLAGTSKRAEEVMITFYLAYEKEIPKKIRDDLEDLFRKRYGVLQGYNLSSPGASCLASGTKGADNQVNSDKGIGVKELSSDSESTPDKNVRKRNTPRSLSMIERQIHEVDSVNTVERKVARRCLSSEFIDNTSQLKTLEVEAAEYQLIAAQRRLRIHALEEQVAAKNRELQELRRNIHESSSSLTSLVENERRRCTAVEQELGAERSTSGQLRAEILRLQTSLNEQRLRREEKEQAILVRDEQLQQLRTQLSESVKNEFPVNNTDYEQLRSELDEAQRNAESARREASERRAHEEIMSQRLLSTDKRIRTLDLRLTEEIETTSRLRSEFEHLEDLENMVEVLQRDLTREEERRRAVEESLQSTEMSMNDLRQSIDTKQQQLNEALRERDAARQERDDVVNELEASQQRVQQCELNLRLAQIALDESRRSEPRDWVIERDEILFTDQVLGVGAWGCVKVGQFRGTEVAVKQIHQLILSPHNRRLFEREMTIASRCRHPCLLQFIGATCDDGSPLFLAEMLETDLRKLLSRHSLEFREIVVIFLDIARALSYLHGSKPSPIIHRDISSSNVLMWNERNQWRAKLSDYGAANFMRLSMSCNPGASLYSAPEAGTSEQTPQLDVFSFGVLLCESCIRELPVPSDREDQISRITSQRCQDLVNQCVQQDPIDRPTALGLVELLSQWKITT